jgi:hypothetical protein
MTTQIKALGKPWSIPRRYPDLVFWVCFLALNAFLFLPFYLLNLSDDSSLQLLTKFREAPFTALFNVFIWRDNADPFRINSELAVMLALWVNVAWVRRGQIKWFMASIYFVALFYYLYESIMLYLYRDEPVFYNHYFLIRDGLSFLAEHLHISVLVYLGVLVGAAVLLGIIITLIRTLIDRQLPSQVSRTTRLAIMTLAIAVLLSAVTYRDVSADPRMVISSLTYKLEKNIAASMALYHSIANFDDAEIHTAYNYDHYRLATKPNVYLLFIESYGSVLYKRPDYRITYIDLLNRIEQRLKDNDFHLASSLSQSPTWGGGSWLAYTSAIYGLHIESHPQYLTLMDRYQTTLPRYPDLGNYMRSQGYHYFWTTSISNELSDTKWERYKRFYGIDEYLRYSDLEFSGPRYGWGPVPPDQYVLAYTRDVAMRDQEKPLFMFYITQNSHYPYEPLPTLVEDWHDLNIPAENGDPLPAEGVEQAQLRANYLKAIDYSLNMLTDFILNHADENAIFVLVGDHQPPRVSRRADGYETPIHIISRDPAFIDNLDQYGFVNSMVVPVDPIQATSAQTSTVQAGTVQSDTVQSNMVESNTVLTSTLQVGIPPLRHEGIYSLLVRTLVQTYGEHPEDAPPYLPNGVTPPDWIVASNEESAK